VSLVYLIFGFAAVAGGGVGGTLADRLGTKRTILTTIIIFGAALFTLPYTTFALPVFLVVMVIWGMMNWSITPALQSYLIESAPETSEVQQSLNNSALHFGIAFGSFIGGIVIEQTTVLHNAAAGGVLVIFALVAALISMYGGRSFVPEKDRRPEMRYLLWRDSYLELRDLMLVRRNLDTVVQEQGALLPT